MLPIQILNMILVHEEERRNAFRVFNAERRLMRTESDPYNLNDDYFIKIFRLTKDMSHYLMQQIVPHMTYGANSAVAIKPEIRIFTALAFFATGGYQRNVGCSYNISISQQSVSFCVNEVSQLIVAHLTDEWIVFPTEQNDVTRVKTRFMEKTRFPGTIGAIDCTHVAIIAPIIEEHNYVNRKGYHSKNIQAVCI